MRNSSFFQKFIGVFLTLVFISPDALALTNTILNPVTFVQQSDAKWDTYLEGLPMGWKDDHTAYLGVSSNDALGKPSDDVFEFYISEAELASDKFTLSYLVNGVDDAKSLPFTINGLSQYGESAHQEKEGWQRVGLRISSRDLVAGRNTVLFTLPEGIQEAQVAFVIFLPDHLLGRFVFWKRECVPKLLREPSPADRIVIGTKEALSRRSQRKSISVCPVT